MNKFSFKKATKLDAKLRMAICGPSGSGKTYTALAVGSDLGRVALIDTERGSASKYANLFDFDVLNLSPPHSVEIFIDAILAAQDAGYGVIIIDSLSHAWEGEGGALDQVDKATKRSKSGNSYFAWRDVTPAQRRLVDCMLTTKSHVIATMRAKTEYVIENVNGRSVPRKVGLAPIQRKGIEYEFDIVADMDWENNFMVSKSRCPELAGEVIHKPGAGLAGAIKEWLSGEEAAEKPRPAPKPVPKPINFSVLPTNFELVSVQTGETKTFPKDTKWVDISRDFLSDALERSKSEKFSEEIRRAINVRSMKAMVEKEDEIEKMISKFRKARKPASKQAWADKIIDHMDKEGVPSGEGSKYFSLLCEIEGEIGGSDRIEYFKDLCLELSGETVVNTEKEESE